MTDKKLILKDPNLAQNSSSLYVPLSQEEIDEAVTAARQSEFISSGAKGNIVENQKKKREKFSHGQKMNLIREGFVEKVKTLIDKKPAEASKAVQDISAVANKFGDTPNFFQLWLFRIAVKRAASKIGIDFKFPKF